MHNNGQVFLCFFLPGSKRTRAAVFICQAVSKGQKHHVCIQGSGLWLYSELRIPHPSPPGRSASVSKPSRQAIRQAEGSPEPLNKTFSQPSEEREHGDKYHGCERCRWDYQWRANGCSGNLPASLSLSHQLPLEPERTSLRDPELFTDHWLKASLSWAGTPLPLSKGLRSGIGSPGAFCQGHNEEEERQSFLPLSFPPSLPSLSLAVLLQMTFPSCSRTCWKLFTGNKQNLEEDNILLTVVVVFLILKTLLMLF